jgi:hypothetical protein
MEVPMNVRNPSALTCLRYVLGLALAFGCTQLVHATGGGRELRVSNRGVDSANCGSKGNPCRSINQAIANAADGDTIAVGSGRYGDINGDGDLDDPGEERSVVGARCVVCVFKGVRIISLHGARITTIVGVRDDNTLSSVVVGVGAHATFGAPDHGFTITGGSANGLEAFRFDTRVSGNTAVGNAGVGFLFNHMGRPLLVDGNTAVGNRTGFVVVGCIPFPCEDDDPDGKGSFVVRGNYAFGNQADGFDFEDIEALLVNNVASNNTARGFAFFGGQIVARGNTATANGQGFATDANDRMEGGAQITRNTAVGNRVAGFLFGAFFVVSRFHENNIYGNGDGEGFVDSGGNSHTNCGVRDPASFDNDLPVADGRNNFWGQASGPGANPGDEVCVRGMIVAPAATIPFPITR